MTTPGIQADRSVFDRFVNYSSCARNNSTNLTPGLDRARLRSDATPNRASRSAHLVFTDLDERYVVNIENAVLHFQKSPADKSARATLNLTKAIFLQMMTDKAGPVALLTSDQTKIEGSTVGLAQFFSMIEKSPGVFPIVTR